MASIKKATIKPNIYLAFPDGVFHYVCRECTMVCCYRSAEFDGSFGKEIQQLVQLYPAMEITAIRRRGDVLTFTTPSGRCYFLNNDHRCDVEIRHGKALKPTACRVFPFNNYHRLGKTFVVGLNFLCPLRLQVPAAPGQVEGTHAQIEAHLRESPYLAGSYFDSLKQLSVHPAQKPLAALAEEISFRDACSRALGRQSFTAALRGASTAPEQLEAFTVWAAERLSLELSLRPATRDHIDDLLLALASMLRLNLLFLPAEKRLRVLALSELVLRRLLTLAGAHPAGPADAATPKGAMEVLSRLSPALSLLAIADEPARAEQRAVKNIPSFGDAQMTFAAFEILRAAVKEEPLTEVLEKNLTALSVADRMALLMDLAHFIGSAKSAKKKKRNPAPVKAAA
jgi:Fe-S-cluster containining protein